MTQLNICNELSMSEVVSQIDFNSFLVTKEQKRDIDKKIKKYLDVFIESDFTIKYGGDDESSFLKLWVTFECIKNKKKFYFRGEFKFSKKAETRNVSVMVCRVNSAKVPFERFQTEFAGLSW